MTDQPTPIDKAVDRVLARQPDRIVVQLVATATSILIPADGGLRFVQPDGIGEPRLFILQSDGQAWQAVNLAGGTWELHPAPDDKLPPTAPQLWRPPS